MARNKTFRLYVFFLSSAVIFLSGCVYLTHLDEVMFMQGLETSQKEIQAESNKEEELYSKLKTDLDNGRLNKTMQKRKIIYLYGEPALCRPAEGQAGIKETCIYRKPTGGLSAEIILLNLDTQDRLCSWQIQDPEK